MADSVRAQSQTGSLRSKRFLLQGDTILLDTLSISQATFQWKQASVDTACYTLDAIGARLIRSKNCSSEETGDSAEISFRVFPVLLSRSYQNKDRKKATLAELGSYNPFVYTPIKQDADMFKFDGLTRSGSISRGISVGNNQDLAVNSALNLQLSGKLTPDIDVTAAITDENIPIQPDGNTQQLQDFDRVFIKLNNESTQLTVGDFQINRPESYFMNFNKRLQGASIQTQQKLQLIEEAGIPEAKVSAGGSVAVARGRFNRNNIIGIEGNQGPYRLRGPNNEQFIIILSGSEKVYIDGRLLRRGQENDYIIDYNNAEITFTTRNIMTKDLRIFVEFEFADRNYARSLVHINTEIEQGKLQARLNVYSEQDSRNQPLQQQLTDEQKLILALAGDNLSQAVVPSIDSVGFSTEQVLYRRIDTLVNGAVFPGVMVFSTNPNEAIYRATFSNVGSGNGNYVQTTSAANGRVFGWVAPINGIPQGSFEPIVQLVPPLQRQMVTLGLKYDISKNLSLMAEGALSKNDLNTFSELDASDNNGYAFRVAMEHRKNLSKDSLPWRLVSTISYEQVDRFFSPLERFRNVEFDRDWNLQQLSAGPAIEYIPRLQLNLSKGQGVNVNYLFSAFIRENQFMAQQHSITSFVQKKGYNFNYNGSYTQNESTANGSDFYRHRILAQKQIRKIVVGYRDEYERNLLTDVPQDTLRQASYQFFDRQVFLTNADTARQKFNLFYRIRTDDGVRSRNLNQYAWAESYGFSLGIVKGEAFDLRTITTYRRLEIRDTLLTSQQADQTLVNRVELGFRLFKSAIVATTFYEVGSGLETRKEFIYLEVPPGQGQYSWTDYNNNGIRELNEFEIALFSDQAKFIRIFTPTTDFIRVFSNQFNQVLNVKAPISWAKKKGWKAVLARFSSQTAFRSDGRTSASDALVAYNPFAAGIDDPELITLNRTLRQTFFFNRNDPKFGFDLSLQRNGNKALLNNGFEARDNNLRILRSRWSPGSLFTFNLDVQQGEKTSLAEFFSNRNFVIAITETEPRVTYQPNPAFRLAVSYKLALRENAEIYGGELARSHNAGFDLKYNVAEKGSFQGRMNMILIDFNGDQNTPIAFEMQEGLRDGTNFTWGIGYQRTLSNNMQLNVNYDGRRSPDAPTIHTGGVQVRVFF